MMRKVAQLLLMTSLCMASGCVLTLDSLFTSKDVTYDSALEGVWKAEGATWTIKPLDVKGGRYRLQTEMKGQPTERWYCTLGLVGTNRFLELCPQRPGEIHPKTFFGGHFMELRSFWSVALNRDTLTLASMSSQWLDAMLKQNKVRIKHEQRDGHVLFLTASTPELRDFVAQYAHDPGAFPSSGGEKGITFLRANGAAPTLGQPSSSVTAVPQELSPRMVLSLTNATDAELTVLRDKPELDELSLKDCQVTDAGLAQIRQLRRLQNLDLSYTRVTDAGLAALKEMKDLQSLNLARTSVTEAGLANLKGLTKLRTLNLHGSTVAGDGGLANLREMKALQTLDLGDTKRRTPPAPLVYLTDAGLANLQDLTALETLDLSFAHVTDVGLAELREIKHLRHLNLACTQVTDAGLTHLKNLKNLKTINLVGTKVTKAGIEDLKKALPNTEIAG